jgi:hypothetical protein
VHFTAHDAISLELTQLLGEHLLADAGQLASQPTEAASTTAPRTT